MTTQSEFPFEEIMHKVMHYFQILVGGRFTFSKLKIDLSMLSDFNNIDAFWKGSPKF